MKSEKNHIRVGCGCIILNEKEEVLLLKRSKILENEPGMWSRPGGTVKFGESVEEALKREVKEEIYVDIEIVRFLEYTEIINEKEGKHWIALGFLAKIKSGEVKNLEPHKHDDVKWFPLNNIPEKLTTYTNNSINAYLMLKRS